MSCPAHIILLGGTRGGGKTESQLMRFRMRVGQGYGRFWRGIILDRAYKNLDDMVIKSKRLFNNFNDGAKFLEGKADYKWVWPTGEELLFRSAKNEEDYWDFHGQEFPYIGYNELTRWPNLDLFEKMMSCNRSSFRPQDYPNYINGRIKDREGRTVYVPKSHKHAREVLLPKLPLEVVATTNPHGVGHGPVKKRFIDPVKPGQLLRNSVEVFNPQTQQDEVITKLQVYLFSSYRENIYLTPEYVAELESITDPNLRAAWLFGSWDIVSGGMFDGVWDQRHHVIPPFAIPTQWRIMRSFDYGQSRPFSVGWWAISDGCDVLMPDGTVMATVRGDMFRIGEWYGTSGKTNEGLNMLATDITVGIIERELAMGIHTRVKPGPADNSIWDMNNGDSIANDMARAVRVNGRLMKGVTWIRSDKSPGSRKQGWLAIRKRLDNAKVKMAPLAGTDKLVPIPRTAPGIFAFNNCKYYKDQMGALPRDEKDPDDVDTESEDHLADEVRYAVLSMNAGARGGVTNGT
ncbi:terminase large subunit [Stenotrophomonas phage Siara]|uniref:Terminase large subunit n=1 Tax=Stenotrophomonas phage Siara TaxID=2859658 RepID=A0AAE8BHX9_9CAUD|nr:terminase large subunit [Stenotrophomonas phage Siara]QYW02035.1 terminase large subunit [Stenotrophomonas phage Siara]